MFFFLLLLLLFLTSNKTNERVPSQQGASTTCNLTYWELSQQTYLQTLLASLVVAKGIIQTLQVGGEGVRKDRCGQKGDIFSFSERGWGGGELVTKIHVTYSRHQFPSDTNNHLYPSKTFRPGTCYFFKIFQPAKIELKNRYLLRTRSIGCPCFSFTFTLHWINKIPVSARGGGYTWVPWSPLSSQGAKSHSSLVEAKL